MDHPPQPPVPQCPQRRRRDARPRGRRQPWLRERKGPPRHPPCNSPACTRGAAEAASGFRGTCVAGDGVSAPTAWRLRAGGQPRLCSRQHGSCDTCIWPCGRRTGACVRTWAPELLLMCSGLAPVRAAALLLPHAAPLRYIPPGRRPAQAWHIVVAGGLDLRQDEDGRGNSTQRTDRHPGTVAHARRTCSPQM